MRNVRRRSFCLSCLYSPCTRSYVCTWIGGRMFSPSSLSLSPSLRLLSFPSYSYSYLGIRHSCYTVHVTTPVPLSLSASGTGAGAGVGCWPSLRLSYLGFLAYTAYAWAFACLVGWRARGFVIALAVERVVGLVLCLLAVFGRTTPYRRAGPRPPTLHAYGARRYALASLSGALSGRASRAALSTSSLTRRPCS